MTVFKHYDVQRNPTNILISADYILEHESSKDESFQLGTPKWWDDYVADKIDFKNFDVYFLCFYEVPNGCYNAVTNHKGVWGLANLPKGIYNAHYQMTKGRMYFGVLKVFDAQSFCDICVGTALVLSKETTLDVDGIFRILSNAAFDPKEVSESQLRVLEAIYSMYPEATLLKYTYWHENSLRIWGKNLKKWFARSDCASHEGAADVSCRQF